MDDQEHSAAIVENMAQEIGTTITDFTIIEGCEPGEALQALLYAMGAVLASIECADYRKSAACCLRKGLLNIIASAERMRQEAGVSCSGRSDSDHVH